MEGFASAAEGMYRGVLIVGDYMEQVNRDLLSTLYARRIVSLHCSPCLGGLWRGSSR